MIIEKNVPIGEHELPLNDIIYYILVGMKEGRYNIHYCRLIIMKQIEYCKKRDEIYERRERETAYQARLEWNRLIDCQ
jgi:hypothetical protein